MATVLVVDDQASIRELLRLVLLRLGHDVITAADGEEALAAAREHHPALVLSDVAMPRRSGLDLLQDLAAEPRLRNTPVVLTSAACQVDYDEAAVFRFVPKPFRLEELEQAVEDALAWGRAAA
jgi:CheY-like chemotaxis protein